MWRLTLKHASYDDGWNTMHTVGFGNVQTGKNLEDRSGCCDRKESKIGSVSRKWRSRPG